MTFYNFPPFGFDPGTGRLRKHGLRIKLQQKPQIILTALLEKPGETVSRQELYRRLWPQGVHVDFEQGLNVAIKKLRDALNDDSESPVYILTLPGLGYRFIGKLESELQIDESQDRSPSAEVVHLQSEDDIGGRDQLRKPDNRQPNHTDDPGPIHSWWGLSRVRKVILGSPAFFGLGAIAFVSVLLGVANRPLARTQVTENLPHNSEAARLYSQGVAQLEHSDAVDARALLNRVIEIEPEYPLAHALLSRSLTALGFSADARAEAERALALSENLSADEKLLLQAQVCETRFDWDKAIEVYRSLFVLSPNNLSYGLRLAHAETAGGRPAMAMETLRHLQHLRPESKLNTELNLAEAEAAGAFSDFRHEQQAAARAAEEARKSGETLMVARAEVTEGEALRALGNFDEAQLMWTNAKERFASIGDRGSVVRILIDEGKVHWQKGELAKAEQSYEEAEATSEEIGDQADFGRALAGLGQIKMFQESGDAGKKLCEEALSVFRRIGNKKEEAYTLSLMADIIAYQHSEARRLYEQSMQLSRQINDRSGVAGRLMDLGIMATVQGDLAMAEQQLQDSLLIYREIGERNREALQLANLAIVYKWQGRLGDAERLGQQAIAILQEVGEINVRGQVRQNLALIQMEAKKLDEAEQSIRLAMEEHRQAGDSGSLTIARANLAEVLVAEGKWDESRDQLEQYGRMVHWTKPIGEHETALSLTRARLYAADGLYAKAKREATHACEQSTQKDQGSLHMKALLVLAEIEWQSGNRAGARLQLEQLARMASAMGFGLIRDKAQEAMRTGNVAFRRAG